MDEKTTLEIQREKEFENHRDKYKFIVVNTDEGQPTLVSHFNHIEQVLHKVKLDIMTNVNLGMSTAKITVELQKV